MKASVAELLTKPLAIIWPALLTPLASIKYQAADWVNDK